MGPSPAPPPVCWRGSCSTPTARGVAGTEPREVCGTPTAATGGAQTVTVTAQDADANRAAGYRDTPTFQVSILARPTLVASPAPFPVQPPVV